MAISPPSDIVLDVARAVDPTELDTARQALARRVGAMAPTGTDAAFSLSSGTTASAGFSRQAKPPQQAEAYKKFEAMVLDTFIQNMLPQDASAVYGDGLSGDMWKSMMSGKLAEAVADRGGIGIAQRLLGDRYQDGDVQRPVGPVSRGPERDQIDMESALSSALVKQVQGRVTDAFRDDTTVKTGVSTGDKA